MFNIYNTRYDVIHFPLGISGMICAEPDYPKTCHFPFVFKGENYTTCITLPKYPNDKKTPWCALTPNFDEDGGYYSWCHCQQQGKLDILCVFVALKGVF